MATNECSLGEGRCSRDGEEEIDASKVQESIMGEYNDRTAHLNYFSIKSTW